MIFKLILISVTLFSSLSYAAPKRVTRPDPETMTVTGERLNPNFKEGSINPFYPGAHVVVAGGALSPGNSNEVNKEKAKEKKKESDSQQNDFWSFAYSVIVEGSFQSWISETLAKLARPEIHIGGGSNTRIEHPDGTVETTKTCLDIAINTKNKSTCVQININDGPNNLKMVQITRLIADDRFSQGLVYSTNDTITFYVESLEDLNAKLNAVELGQ